MTTSELEDLESRLDQIEMLDHTSANALLRDASIYARKVFGDLSPHVVTVENVQFRHPTLMFNSGHHMNSDIWSQGVRDLRSAFDAMRYETKLVQKSNSISPVAEKITLEWLINHVPVKLWVGAITLLAAVFSFGYAAGSNRFLSQLLSLFKSSQ